MFTQTIILNLLMKDSWVQTFHCISLLAYDTRNGAGGTRHAARGTGQIFDRLKIRASGVLFTQEEWKRINI